MSVVQEQRELGQQLAGIMFGDSLGEEEAPEAPTEVIDEVTEEALEGADLVEDELYESADEDLEAEAEDEEQSDLESGQEPQVFTVRVDGEELEVPLPELLAGYSRHADYTKKTQEVASTRKELNTEMEVMRQERAQYAAALPQLQQVIEQSSGPQPDPANYADRNEYLWAKDAWNTQQAQLQAVNEERMRVQQQQQLDNQRALAAFQAEQGELLMAQVPEWQDAEIRRRESGEIADYLRSMGANDDAINGLSHHLDVVIARKAMMFDRLRATGQKKAKQATSKTKAMGPGTPDKGVSGRKLKKQLARAKETGSVEDIAPLMGKLLVG